MSTFSVRIWIGPITGPASAPINAVVDTGATFTHIPAPLLETLGIPRTGRATFELGDGRRVDNDTGRALIRIDGQEDISRVVFGAPDDPILLGAITLESMLLGVDPHNKRLIPIHGIRYFGR